VLSVFVYESRAEENATIPRGEISEALSQISKIYGRVFNIESDHNLEPMRAPDFGFCWPARSWASGQSLTSVLKDSELTVGDFVRNMKQIVDLLRQLRSAVPDLQPTIEDALKRIDRGVIIYAGAVI